LSGKMVTITESITGTICGHYVYVRSAGEKGKCVNKIYKQGNMCKRETA
jgi:hypothetical protein